MTKRSLVITFVLAALLSGCDEQPKTKEWFKDNPDEMNKVFDKCQKSGDETVNCRNAKAAHLEIQQKNAPVPQY